MPHSILKNWLGIFTQKKFIAIGLLGFSTGIPYFLTASTLAIWLKSIGYDNETIAHYAIAALPSCVSFLWAPFIDRAPIPYLTQRFGRRRAWLLFSQLGLFFSLSAFYYAPPSIELAILTSFFAATQQAVMLAYQMERLHKEDYGPGEAIGVMGGRLGMLLGGAGSLYLSVYMSWEAVYLLMAITVCVGIFTTLCIQEPTPLINPETLLQEKKIHEYLARQPKLPRRLNIIFSWLYAAVICPFVDFFSRSGWLAALGIMFFYKFGDNLIGTMPHMMYLELGYSRTEIADTTKIFGMCTSIAGGLFGGILITRIGFNRSLLYFCFLHMIATLMYILTYKYGYNMRVLYASIAFEHFTAGMRTAALFAYQLTLSNPVYAATQLALLTSIVNLGRTVFSWFSGTLVLYLGWIHFYNLAILASIVPLLICLHLMKVNNEFIFPKKALQIP